MCVYEYLFKHIIRFIVEFCYLFIYLFITSKTAHLLSGLKVGYSLRRGEMLYQ